MDWFLYDKDLRHERPKLIIKRTCKFEQPSIFFVWGRCFSLVSKMTNVGILETVLLWQENIVVILFNDSKKYSIRFITLIRMVAL